MNTATEETKIPSTMREDRDGNWVHKKNIKKIDLARDKLVNSIVKNALKISGTLGDFREESFGSVSDFVDKSGAEYGAKPRGVKGNMTLFNFNGSYKLVISINETRSFDERLQSAKSLIDECIHDWMKGGNTNIQSLIDDAFQVDKEGKVSVQRILGLRRHKMVDKEGKPDERWQRAMDAVADSMQVKGSKRYIRLYRRDEKSGEYKSVPLDAANA